MRGRIPPVLTAVLLLLVLPIPAMGSTPPNGICSENPNAPMDVVLVLDRSQSVEDADPSNLRGEATRVFLDGLADIASGQVSGTPRYIAVSAVMFNAKAEVVQDWRPVASRQDAAAVAQTIDSEWSEPRGYTDQVQAFDLALDLLEARDGRCRILVLFTDGVIDTGKDRADDRRSGVIRHLVEELVCERDTNPGFACSGEHLVE